MAKPTTFNWLEKPAEQLEAEAAGRALLAEYCKPRGVQAMLCKRTDMIPSQICRLINGERHLNLEAAMLIEVATDGALPVEALCPSRASLLKTLMRNRARKV